MSYKKLNENQIEHSYTQKRKIDLNLYKNELLEIREQLKNMPKEKTEPDAETLAYWNEMNVSNVEIQALKNRAEYIILKVMKPIYDENKLPEKWVQPLYDFWNWLQNEL